MNEFGVKRSRFRAPTSESIYNDIICNFDKSHSSWAQYTWNDLLGAAARMNRHFHTINIE